MKQHLTLLIVAAALTECRRTFGGPNGSIQALHNTLDVAKHLIFSHDLAKRQCRGNCVTCFGPGYQFCPGSGMDCYLPGDEDYGIEMCSNSEDGSSDTPSCASQYGPQYTECPDGVSCHDVSSSSSAACFRDDSAVEGCSGAREAGCGDELHGCDVADAACDATTKTTKTDQAPTSTTITSSQVTPKSSASTSSTTALSTDLAASSSSSTAPVLSTTTTLTLSTSTASSSSLVAILTSTTTSNSTARSSSVAFVTPIQQASSAAPSYRIPNTADWLLFFVLGMTILYSLLSIVRRGGFPEVRLLRASYMEIESCYSSPWQQWHVIVSGLVRVLGRRFPTLQPLSKY